MTYGEEIEKHIKTTNHQVKEIEQLLGTATYPEKELIYAIKIFLKAAEEKLRKLQYRVTEEDRSHIEIL